MDQRTTFWTDHVAAAKLVSIPTSAYAREHNISVAALYYWQSKLKKAALPPDVNAKPPTDSAKFVALRVAAPIAPARPIPCALILGSGIRLDMAALPEPAWLLALERAAHGER